jgi:hypothetical protein
VPYHRVKPLWTHWRSASYYAASERAIYGASAQRRQQSAPT